MPIQLTIPTAGIAELAQQSLGDLLRTVGKVFIQSVMESEVEQLVGRRSERLVGRGAYRWGSEEGLDETLTLLDLRITPRLRNSLSSTNAIESGFSTVAKICAQVKRWQGSDHRLRWVASAILFAESHWNKIHGYRHMPVLVKALEAAWRQRTGKAAAAVAA